MSYPVVGVGMAAVKQEQHVTAASAAAAGNSGGNGFDLLDLLAEVASQTLENDRSLREVNAAAKETKKPRRARGRERRLADYDTFDLGQIRRMSQVSLLRLFAEQEEADEMRRTFAFRCRLMPESECGYVSQSFGSEARAKADMKKHLAAHVAQMADGVIFRAESVEARKRRLNSVEDVKQEVYVERRVLAPVTAAVADPDSPPALPIMPPIPASLKSENIHLPTSPLPPSDDVPVPTKPMPAAVLLPLPPPHPPPPAPAVIKQEANTATAAAVVVESIAATQAAPPAAIAASEISNLPEPTSFDHDHSYLGRKHVAGGAALKREQSAAEEEEEDDEELFDDAGKSSYDEWIQGSLQPEEETEASNNVTRGVSDLVGYVENAVGLAGECVPLVGSEIDISPPTAPATVTSEGTKVIRSAELPVVHPGHKGELSAAEKREVAKGASTAGLQPDEIEERKLALEAIKALQASGSSGDEFWCRVCWPNKKFTAYTTLLSHLRSHAGFRPYECHLCNAFFTRQHSLNYHLLIHTNETRFTCTDCGRKFRHPSHFKEHRRRHTGESPYECSDCMIRYKTRNTYKRHLKIYHGKVLTSTGNLIALPSQEFAQVREAEIKKEQGKMERKLNRQRQRKNVNSQPTAAASAATSAQQGSSAAATSTVVTLKPSSTAAAEASEKKSSVESVSATPASQAPASVVSSSEQELSEKENMEFLHDSDSLMADNDEVAAISRVLENREAMLNGKAVVAVAKSSAASSASYYPSTDSEFSSPDPQTAEKSEDKQQTTGETKVKSTNSTLPKFDASPPAALAPKSIRQDSGGGGGGDSQSQPSGQDKSPNLLKKRDAKSAFNPIKIESKQVKRRKKAIYPKPLLSIQDNIEIKKQVLVSSSTSAISSLPIAGPKGTQQPQQQQAFLANINGKQVLLIPKKPSAQVQPAAAVAVESADGAPSKLEQCLRYGSATTGSPKNVKAKVQNGIKLVSSQQHKIAIAAAPEPQPANQKCASPTVAGGILVSRPTAIASQQS